MTLFVDVSSNNHPGNAAIAYEVAALVGGVGGAYVKASESTDYKNPWREIDGKGFASAGCEVGYYHFARPQYSDPGRQADWFLQNIANLPRYLPMMLDLEDGAQLGWPNLGAWAQAFMQRIEGEGIECGVYVNRYYFENLRNCPWGRPLWIAAPGANPEPNAFLWQYGNAQVAGIPGRVDVNRFYGKLPPNPDTGGAMKLNQPIVGPPIFTVTGGGYWLVAADGGIFNFGDAEPFGAGDPLPSEHLNAPITGGARSPGGHGLLLCAGDGGTFSFGDAPNYGSVPGLPG
jgi:GH25 family lysozyme M1 (1,4-beta-N-acetylmuramidase)